MIKLVVFLKRRPDLSPEAFHHHWREVHGPLMAASSASRHIRRYEQHRPLGARQTWDGVVVQWFDDMAAFQAFLADPDYEATIRPDEDRFLDRDALEVMLVEDALVVIEG